MPERGVTRRQILGGAAAAGLGWCAFARLRRGAWKVSASSVSVELTAQRRGIYEALVGAVVVESPLRLDPACASSAAAHFAGVYARWSADARERADGVLDALEGGPHAAAFSRLPRAARTSFLRACTHVTSTHPSGAEHARLALAQNALGLVAVAVGPGEDAGWGLVSI
jgi:hypothetical protein